jgi:hypothetical protein
VDRIGMTVELVPHLFATAPTCSQVRGVCSRCGGWARPSRSPTPSGTSRCCVGRRQPRDLDVRNDHQGRGALRARRRGASPPPTRASSRDRNCSGRRRDEGGQTAVSEEDEVSHRAPLFSGQLRPANGPPLGARHPGRRRRSVCAAPVGALGRCAGSLGQLFYCRSSSLTWFSISRTIWWSLLRRPSTT